MIKLDGEGNMELGSRSPCPPGIVGQQNATSNSGNDPDPRDWLAAIINGSDDAIISKDLSGNIRTWNPSATRLFGYHADEVVGKPITILIPEDRLDEEPLIIAEIRRGNRVDHVETVRRRKDGSLIDLSLTISPVRNAAGAIVGASKIARDITERRQAREKQRLLYGEMQHRIKNLFALIGGIVSLSARTCGDVPAVAESIHSRLAALSRAHELTMPNWQGDALMGQTTTLIALLLNILKPYAGHHDVVVTGDDPQVGARALTNVALLLHELATNAAKYGCLSEPEGRLSVHVQVVTGMVDLAWTEYCKKTAAPPSSYGFGNRLETSVLASLGATIERNWLGGGLAVRIAIPIQPLAD